MKQRLVNWLLKRTLNVVVKDDIIFETTDKSGSKLYIGNNIVGDVELRQLVAECKSLEGSRVWSIMNETLKQKALDRGWNKSNSIEELNVAKAMYHTLDVQDSIIKLIRKYERK